MRVTWSSSENVNSDMEIRIIDPYSSFIEDPQKTEYKRNNSESESEDESISKKPNFDKTEQIRS